MKLLSIEDFGAVKGDRNNDAAVAINAGFRHLMDQETGGTLWIPDGRYYTRTQINPPRGSNARSIALRGLGKQSVIDIRRCKSEAGFRYNGEGTDGPTHMTFRGFRVRGNGENIGMKLDFQSASHMSDMTFDQLKNALDLSETYAFTLRDCTFLNVSHNCVKFRTNAHNFRLLNCNMHNVAQLGGAVINFANTDGRETHTVQISGNDFEQIGTLIRVSSKSGGLTGLVGEANYTEGFTPGVPIFKFPKIGVRGFYWTGGSFSQGRQTAPPEPVEIHNVHGGRIEGIRLFRMELVVKESSSLYLGVVHSARGGSSNQ